MQEGAGLQRLGKQALVVLRHLEVAQVLDVAFVRQRWVGQQEITQLMALPIQYDEHAQAIFRWHRSQDWEVACNFPSVVAIDMSVRLGIPLM